MVRAAAKNHRDVAIVVATKDYASILEELTEYNGHTTLQTRFNLAIRAYEHTAAYDGMIANHFGCLVEGGSAAYPRTFSLQLEKVQEMRYGENPHQSAAFYREADPKKWASVVLSNYKAKHCRITMWPIPTPRWSASRALASRPVSL